MLQENVPSGSDDPSKKNVSPIVTTGADENPVVDPSKVLLTSLPLGTGGAIQMPSPSAMTITIDNDFTQNGRMSRTPMSNDEIQRRLIQLFKYEEENEFQMMANDVESHLLHRTPSLEMHLWNSHSVEAWSAFQAANPSRGDLPVLEENMDAFARIRARMESRGSIVMLDMGPGGGEYTMRTKTYPILNALHAGHHISMDKNQWATIQAQYRVQQEFPDMDCHARTINFFTDAYRLESASGFNGIKLTGSEPIVATMLGNTFGNIAGPIAADPHHEATAALSHVRKHLKPGDVLILGLNQNTQRETSYDDPLFYEFQDKMFEHVRAILPKAGFEAGDFEPFMRRIPATNTHVLGYTAQRDATYRIRDKTIPVRKGEERYAAVSRRYSDAFIAAVSGKSGFKVDRVLKSKSDPSYPWKIHVLQAV